MSKPKRQHPADAHNAAIIANADHYEVSLFLGVGRYEKVSVASEAEAQCAGAILLDQNPECSRRPLIYAVAASGASAIIPFKA